MSGTRRYYRSKLGFVGYYETGNLHCPGAIHSVHMEDLVPATRQEIAECKKRERKLKSERAQQAAELARRAKELEAVFGFDPREVGLRPRGFWVVNELGCEEREAGARAGDLCIKARDGASNPPDPTAGAYGNYVGTACDAFDGTFRYYYYRPTPGGEE